MNRRSVHIPAAGYGTRLQAYMDEAGYEPTFPKHLLPTGGPHSETFLGRIARQAIEIPDASPPVIHANSDNSAHIAAHPDIDHSLEIRVGTHASFFEPMIDALLDTRQPVVGMAGDFYADLDWKPLLQQHDERHFPVTFVVAQTVAVERGLVYDIAADGAIRSFERPDKTTGDELINLGVYLFDPEPETVKILEEMKKDKEEPIAKRLAEAGLLSSYVLPSVCFNVNTPETYQHLREYTSTLQAE